MKELGLSEATARYQMQRALEDENGIVKSFHWKFYLDEEKFKAVVEDLRSIYPIRLKPYPYPPKEETEARDGLMEMKRRYATLELEYDLLRYRYLETLAWYYDAKSDLAEAQGNGAESCRYFEKMDATLGQAIDLKQQLEKRGVKVDDAALMYLRYIPNDTLKWLKNSRFYGSIDRIFDVSLSKLQPRKEAQMGKSLNGKELGKGISQRKDGLYQARFVNRFGKRETIYAKTLNEIRHQLRTEQYEDEKMLNVISKEMTLDEWYEIWMNTCKKNCRSSTKTEGSETGNRVERQKGF